jgi:hypothetical protein
MITPRRTIIVVTAASLAAAFVVNAVWFATTSGSGRLEPIVGVLGILAGITGLVAERWAAAREARDAALQAINAELRANAELLGATAFSSEKNQPLRRTVYPRLHLSAVDAALAGGSVSARDVALVGELHAWRNQVIRFNAQLALAEILAFTVESESVLRDLREGLQGDEGPLSRLGAAIVALRAQLGGAERLGDGSA